MKTLKISSRAHIFQRPFSGPIWGNLGKAYSGEHKNKLDKSGKKKKMRKYSQSQRFHFAYLALFKIVLLQEVAQCILKPLSLSLLSSSEN